MKRAFKDKSVTSFPITLCPKSIRPAFAIIEGHAGPRSAIGRAPDS